ncbi:hypothetical protein [Microbulbifer elongatus]|uniref:hypothetical protein n=1 Tax=Microbulbifer elongatus TaxID=86173 RepID=UPI001E6143A4|nr:hypothetical protein [Microbulbifer elongatus]
MMLIDGLPCLRKWFSMFAVTLFTVLVTACVPDTDTLDEIEAFSERTETLLEKDRALADEYGALVEELSRTVSETGSAKAAVESGVYDKLAGNMDSALALATQYQQELESLFGKLDQDSPCYHPEIADNLKTAIAEKRQIASALRQLKGADLEEGGAIIVALNATPKSFAAGMSNMVEMFKVCKVPAAMGMTKSELDERSEFAESNDSESGDFDHRSAGDLTVEKYTKSKSVLPLQPIWINRLLPTDVEDVSDLEGVQLSGGVTINEELEVVLPEPYRSDLTKPFTFRITGTVADKYSEYQLAVDVTRVGYTPVASLNFDNADLAKCIDSIASDKGFRFMEEIKKISCTAHEESPLALTELFQLTNLTDIEINNFNMVDMAKAPLPKSISELKFTDGTLDGLPKFTNNHGRLLLWGAKVEDWSQLSKVAVDKVFVDERAADCDLVRSWDEERSDLVVTHHGLDAGEKVARMMRMEDEDNVIGVVSGCTL